jgi:hypothetical protein
MSRIQNRLIAPVIVGLLLLWSPPGAEAGKNKKSNKPTAGRQVQFKETEGGPWRYLGKLGSRTDLSMGFDVDPKGEANGWLRYGASGTNLILKGTLAADGAFSFGESRIPAENEAQGEVTGSIEGRFEAGKVKGTGIWRSPDGKKEYPLTLALVQRTRRIKASGPCCEGEGSWPVFSDPRFRKVQIAFANEVRSAVHSFVAEYGDCPEDDGEWPSNIEFLAHIDVMYFSQNLVSARSSEWGYYGGAHGQGSSHGVNYEVKADGSYAEVPLSRYFKRSSGWESRVSATIVKELKAEGASSAEEMEPDAYANELAESTNYTVDKAGLRFHFDPYEVGAYAEGVFDIFIPFSSLKAFLAADRPR